MHAQATPGQPWAYAGYKLTVYSNTEETLNDLMWWDTVPKVRETLCNTPTHLGHALAQPSTLPSGMSENWLSGIHSQQT